MCLIDPTYCFIVLLHSKTTGSCWRYHRNEVPDEENCEVGGYGGCGQFTMVCSMCDTEDLFETGTHYNRVPENASTGRYAESTLLEIGILFSGGGSTAYQECTDALGMSGYSRKAQSKYFWNYYNAADDGCARNANRTTPTQARARPPHRPSPQTTHKTQNWPERVP